MNKEDELIECPYLSDKLTLLFPNLRIWKDGRVYQTKELVGQEYNLKFYIYPNDHNLPHFHVRSANGEISASFKIEDGEYIVGKIKNSSDLKKIKHFHNCYKTVILEKWDEIHK